MKRKSQSARGWQHWQAMFSAAMTLAVWRWRTQRLLLLIAGLGITCALMLVAALPLFSSVMTTAGLRNVLRAQPNSAQITANAGLQALSTQEVENASALSDAVMRREIGSYLAGAPQRTVITGNWYLNNTSFTLNFYGVPIQTVLPHLQLLQGRLPNATSASSSTIEVMLTQSAANDLEVNVGDLIPVSGLLATKQVKEQLGVPGGPMPYVSTLNAYVVGIFRVSARDPYWNGYTLEAPPLDARLTPPPFLALTDQHVLLTMLDTVAGQHGAEGIFFADKSVDAVFLSYSLDTTIITDSILPELITRLGRLQQDANQTFALSDHPGADVNIIGIILFGLTLHAQDDPSTLEKYTSQVGIAQTPAFILTCEIVALILFFVSTVIGELVERDQLAIAVMRSRGSSRWQIFVSLLVQTLGLCLLAGLLGPLLALGLVILVAPHFLVASNQDALNALVLDPLQVVRSLALFTGIALIGALCTLLVVILLVVRGNILTRRREEARAISLPLWYRQRLDLITALLAIAGYLLILYLQHVQQFLNVQGQTLVSLPLELLAPLLLVLAGILFFIRLFPLLLRGLAYPLRLTRGIAAVLAVTQMERAPRRPMRMALLLGLTIAYVIFSLVFSASQDQRAQDLATYQAVSDFAGYKAALPNTTPEDAAEVLGQVDLVYGKIQGVTSVTVGYVDNRYLYLNGDTSQAYAHKTILTAVDARTFAQTAFWSAQDSQQPLSSLMALLNEQRAAAEQRGVVPAIVAASTWQMLGLKPGMTFHLADNLGEFDATVYVAVAEVEHIPPTDDGVQGALLVDYQSLVAGRAHYRKLTRPNYIWLRVSNTPAAVSRVRAALDDPLLALEDLVDRRAISGDNAVDPLSRSLLGILGTGVLVALLLALLANVLLPLLDARARQTQFAVLRALGAVAGQITSQLAWEMAIVLVTALLLGLLFGGILVATSVSSLVFTSALPGSLVDLSSTALYTLQQIIPVSIVIPPSLLVALLLLLVLCLLAVLLISRLARRPLLAEALLVDDD